MFHEIKQAPSLEECNSIKRSFSCLLCLKLCLWEVQPLFCLGGKERAGGWQTLLGGCLGPSGCTQKCFKPFKTYIIQTVQEKSFHLSLNETSHTKCLSAMGDWE